MPETYTVGGRITIHCTHCDLTLAHTIVAMVEGKVRRVQCNTCKSMRNYKAPDDRKTKAQPSTPVRKRAGDKAVSSTSQQSAWLQKVRDLNPATAVPYSPKIDGMEVKLIDHPSFGLGIVRGMVGQNKIEVEFSERVAVLICNK